MKKRNRTVKKVVAYIFMPLLFIAVNLAAVYILCYSEIENIKSYANLLLLNEVPDFYISNDVLKKDDLIKKFEEADNPSASETEEEAENVIPLSEIEWPVYGEAYAWISCERLGLDSVLYYGDGYELLRKGVGQYLGSYIPGYGKPLMVCAHNTNIFACLEYIEIGDVIKIETSYGEFEYKVEDIKILAATDLNAYDMQKDEEQLIMYTCYPFERLSTRHKDRYFVYCKKISGSVLE